MDDFGLDRMELTGALISMEFGDGGRIHQLWAGDPGAAGDSEEYQFACPPLNMGEEVSDDYLPGTILLGARTSPDEPWAVSRNVRSEPLPEEEGPGIAFLYEFPFLEEIRGTGVFYEVGGPVPQIVWDVTITNDSRRIVEIGELGFPLALNNVCEGFPFTDRGIREMHHERVHVHKFIGGAASYVFAQRFTALPPGLLIFPGAETSWEFYSHVTASVQTPYRWEGIPVVYAHSQATIEREGWSEWVSGHSAIILEPREKRVYQMRFAVAERNTSDHVVSVMQECNRPALRVFPAAVSPYNVGAALEVLGTTPARFLTDAEAELDTDSEQEGGYCLVKPTEPGAVKVYMEDMQGRESEAHFLFTEPIEDLIRKRASWIIENQISGEESVLKDAIVPADNTTGEALAALDSFAGPNGVISSLGDALFLAEKNSLIPEAREIEALDGYVGRFLLDDVQNPGDASVGSVFVDLQSVAIAFSRPEVYVLAACLYGSLARLSRVAETSLSEDEYLSLGARTVHAMFREAMPYDFGIPLVPYLQDLADDAAEAGLEEESDRINALLDLRARDLIRRKYPFGENGEWGAESFEEALFAADRLAETEYRERVLRCMFAARSMSPSWWWYGSDKAWPRNTELWYNTGFEDKGEVCLTPTSAGNAAAYLRTLRRDYRQLDEAYLRSACGGLMGVWALVRADGAASRGFCPDAASRHFGMSWITGDIGISLFHYLRSAAGLVLPTGGHGIYSFGCQFETEGKNLNDRYVVRVWDGVGRRIELRQVGLTVESSVGGIQELEIDTRKRAAALVMQNRSQNDLLAELRVRGMWGNRFKVNSEELQGRDGTMRVQLRMPAQASVKIEVSVIE